MDAKIQENFDLVGMECSEEDLQPLVDSMKDCLEISLHALLGQSNPKALMMQGVV